VAELDADTKAEVLISTGADPDGACVVRLGGELDSSNTAKLEEALAPIIAGRPQRLVFDLSQLRFMDSAGIAVLLRAAAEVPSLALRDPSPIVRRIVEVTGLTGVLEIEQ
jgi:anti-sigma B factor antagonist